MKPPDPAAILDEDAPMMPGSQTESAAVTQPEVRLAFLVKFYKEKEHADSFLQDGLLYARRLKSFREEEDPQRGDRDEGAVLQAASQVYVLQDDGRKLPIKAVAPLRSTYPILDDLNIFCMTHFTSSAFYRGPTRAHLDEVLSQVDDSLPECQKMGEHAVVIVDPARFRERIDDASRRCGYAVMDAAVTYYDTYPDDAVVQLVGPPLRSDVQWRHAYLKHRRYEKQREYRLAFQTHKSGDDPIRLKVGSLQDIGFYVTASKLADRSKWVLASRS